MKIRWAKSHSITSTVIPRSAIKGQSSRLNIPSLELLFPLPDGSFCAPFGSAGLLLGGVNDSASENRLTAKASCATTLLPAYWLTYTLLARSCRRTRGFL